MSSVRLKRPAHPSPTSLGLNTWPFFKDDIRSAILRPSLFLHGKLSKALGVSDKTITAWEERIEEAGPPPLLKEDGSFTLKSQQDWDKWVEYWTRIADPI